ncbi:TPA: hypothetical protein DIV55_02275 [Patescibacteria group bacterium]|uniref:Glycosyltransferase RgtA/B/C/D-like domain-containing protein n=1 Tax=Candidatus Gottesmanbacteria bacterium GW2011_GWA1_43_11 TaxID=1618436 RepID=A0A0G1EMT2_9BACT|nr:MAG: hypothetical protein UV59_C0021G0017 [Candidatus Gottesmanbacteria bacterium GW2011_GWA1_43_11]HCS78548.1 hypothetical protein [Patescibacteria group bacterium]
MNKLLYPLLTSLAVVTGLLISLVPILSGIFFFTFDQARDLLWVKNQVDFLVPTLIGPPGSLEGVFFGPVWLWLLTVPYLAANGDPVMTTLFNAFVVFGAGLLGTLYLYKHHKATAYFFLILTFISPAIHLLTGYAFAQHLLPLLTVVLIYTFAHMLKSGSRKHFFIAIFCIALMFHAEPVVSVFSLASLPVILLVTPHKKNLLNAKTILLAIIVFGLPFLPQIVFDFKHDFLQTRGVFVYLSGTSKSLGDILPFPERLLDRPVMLFTTYQLSIVRSSPFLAAIFLLLSFFVTRKLSIKPFFKALLQASGLYLLSLWIVFTLFPPQFKIFYLDGVVMIYLLWTAIILGALWEKKKLRIFLSLILVVIGWHNLQPLRFYNSWKNGFVAEQKSGSIFKTQKAIVDLIYKDSSGDGFKVYTYSPAIYDYPYQYLFLHYGVSHYGYLPAEFSYLPNQPLYVQKKDLQLKRITDKIKPAGQYLYLIVEPGQYSDRQKKWLTNFPVDQYPRLWQQTFPDGTQLEKRHKLF